jgi:hypothetical protein
MADDDPEFYKALCRITTHYGPRVFNGLLLLALGIWFFPWLFLGWVKPIENKSILQFFTINHALLMCIGLFCNVFIQKNISIKVTSLLFGGYVYWQLFRLFFFAIIGVY